MHTQTCKHPNKGAHSLTSIHTLYTQFRVPLVTVAIVVVRLNFVVLEASLTFAGSMKAGGLSRVS